MFGRKYEIGVFDPETLEQGAKVGDYLSWLLTLQRLVGFVDGHSISPPPLYLLDQHGHQYENPLYSHWTHTQQLSRNVLAKVQHLVNTSELWTSDLEHRFDTRTLNAALLELKRTLINPDTATHQAAIHSCNLTEIVRQINLVSDNLASLKINMADWASLPKDAIIKIAGFMSFYQDFESFKWVCSSWRSAAKEAKFEAKDEHTLPWLMLPKRDSSSRTCRLYSLCNYKVCPINLPSTLLDKDYDNDTKRLLSSYGWLILTLERNKLALFNPNSGAVIQLPKYSFYYEVHQVIRRRPDKFILSANPSITSDFIVFLCLEGFLFVERKIPAMLLYWKNGSDSWIPIVDPAIREDGQMIADDFGFESSFLGSPCRDITFYKGEFYGVNFRGMVVKFNTSQDSLYYKGLTCLRIGEDDELWYYYLVESVGQLLAIRQVYKAGCWRNTTRFEVLELDGEFNRVEEVDSLGNRAVFVGSNSSFSVEASVAHGFKPNCIYNTDDRVTWLWTGSGPGCKDICFYNLTDKKIDKFYQGPSLIGELTPFMWVESPHSSEPSRI